MPETPDPILPLPLRRGDLIGIAAPAGPVRDEAALAAGLRLLTDMGFRTKYQDNLLRQGEYLAGSDRERLAELHSLWRDPEVRAILAVRGGYGCMRLLPELDLDLIRSQPKMLIGFSDLTALLTAIHRKTGLITFHGPMLTTLPRCDDASREAFFRLLTGSPPQAIKPKGLEILRNGAAQGSLLPANLTTITHLVGTPFEPSWQKRILVLEDIGEAPYRIDRLLTHLWAAGRLQQAGGIILGGFDGCGAAEDIWQRVLDLTDDRAMPVWGNFPCGHGTANHILPMGLEATMDSSAGQLLFPKPLFSTAPTGLRFH